MRVKEFTLMAPLDGGGEGGRSKYLGEGAVLVNVCAHVSECVCVDE